MKKIRIIRFALVPVLLLLILLGVSIFKNDNSDVNSAREVLENIKNIRIAIDKYYLESGEFPNFNLNENINDLESIRFKDKNGKEINFREILGQNKFPCTPKYKELEKTNKVNLVENFKKVSNDGGWNYNIKTGEIHANIKYNYFNQSIDWNNF